MINFNGNITSETNILTSNRGFLYGDSVFETVKILDRKILFLEDHYFRLMAKNANCANGDSYEFYHGIF